MSTTGGGSPAGVTTLIFDVLGTVVDEAGSVAARPPRGVPFRARYRVRPRIPHARRTARVPHLRGGVRAGRAGVTDGAGQKKAHPRRPGPADQSTDQGQPARPVRTPPSRSTAGRQSRLRMCDLAARTPVNVLRLARKRGDRAPDDDFDVYAADLADLAGRLIRGAAPVR